MASADGSRNKTDIPKFLKQKERESSAEATAVSNECGSTAFTVRAGSGAGSLPTTETSQVYFLEEWEVRLNAQIWKTGPDGTMHWRDQGDGFFE